MNSIAKRSQNFAFKISIFKILFILCVSLWPLWPKNLLNPRNPWLIISAVSSTKKFGAVVNSWFNQNMKTKPKQSQNKAKQTQFFGGFWRKNFNFSLKIDDTKLNLLCKTKPIYKTTQWSTSHHLIGNMLLAQHQKVWCCDKLVRGSLKTQ